VLYTQQPGFDSAIPAIPWCNLGISNLCARIRLVILGVTCSTDRCVLCPFFVSPSTDWNLNQLQRESNSTLTGLSIPSSDAPVGVNPKCGIPHLGSDGSIGNVANIAACGVSIVVIAALIFLCNRRKAAVGELASSIFALIGSPTSPGHTISLHIVLFY